MKSYHNTTDTAGPVLSHYEESAQSQESLILEWFKARHLASTPSTVAHAVFSRRVPLTSVRRALTNLTNKGELVKTGRQVRGPYGRPEYQWQLADKHRQPGLFE